MRKNDPSIGFVSLGCPKALVDSERMLTQLRAQGYEIAARFEAADLVVVNTCGFIESAVDESLDAIGEALAANGKVNRTGCLGARAAVIRARLQAEDYDLRGVVIDACREPLLDELMNGPPVFWWRRP